MYWLLIEIEIDSAAAFIFSILMLFAKLDVRNSECSAQSQQRFKTMLIKAVL